MPSGGLEVGEAFSHLCQVDPGAPPLRTPSAVTFQMACLGVVLQTPIVQVVYGDPGFSLDAATGMVTVIGEVVEVRRGANGSDMAVVVAERIVF
ncbi:MAG: hypothetical protein KDB10_06085 [Acidimicrobiales bacterium]|nr:hypothetical protein [Acidimicrobiales bacterium]